MASTRGARMAVALGVLVAALWAGRALAAAGQLDHTFSGDGRQLTSFPGATGSDVGQDVAIQNGRIVVAGYSQQAGGYKAALARYNRNGSLDHTFSGDGRQLTRFPGTTGNDGAYTVAIANGKVVVAGYSVQAGATKLALARYNANGSLDHSFSGDGRRLTVFPGAIASDVANAVAIQNGKIVAAGSSQQAGGYEFAVARYNRNGSLDHSFSGDGRRLTAFPGATGDDEAEAVAIQNGKIVVAGYSHQAIGNRLALARYNRNGSLDHSFSGDGRRLTAFPGATDNDVANAVAIENGKIVVAGFSHQAGANKFALARFNSNGLLDHSFSGDGLQLTRFPGAIGDDKAQAVAIENGKIVAAGYSQETGPGYTFAVAVARYKPNGALDHSFSVDGRQLTRFPGATGVDEAFGLAIENGKIVAAGQSQQAAGSKFALARYLGG